MGLIFVVSLFICCGQLCQKQAVECWRGRRLRWREKLVSPWLVAGMLSLGAGMLLWLLALQTLAVSVAYPMLSLNFIWIALVSRFVFHEKTDPRHWLGILLIVAGIACLAPAL